MANENTCVFCGQKPGPFRSTRIQCGRTIQPACKSCEKELENLDELEICRRALVRGLANEPEKIKERIELITEAENRRLSCLRCGTKLVFLPVQELDNSPSQDNIFSNTFDVLPARCPECGKMEFYDPGILRKNSYLAYLIWKDTQ